MTEITTLDDLAVRINSEHAKCLLAVRDAVGRAIEVGRLLAEAKALTPHGEWGRWVADTCSFGARQASSYMRAFANREQIGSGASDLTLRGALAALDPPTEPEILKPSTTERHYVPLRDRSPESRRETCRLWWDQLASQTILLDAAGWDVETISEFLGHPTEDIEAILDPRPPVRFDTIFNGRDLPIDHERYRAAVEDDIESILAKAYQGALHNCEADGFGHVAPILEASIRRYRCRHAAFEDRFEPRIRLLASDDARDKAVFCCVTWDMRNALRINIEGDAHFWSRDFLDMWAAQLKTFEEMEARKTA